MSPTKAQRARTKIGKTLRVLVLEDDENRIAVFRRNMLGSSMVVTSTAADCIKQLQENEWDVLFLDHDLGGLAYGDSSNANTGARVARWLEEHSDRQPEFIIIHSMNGPGCKNMKAALPDAAVIPSAWNMVSTAAFSNPEDIRYIRHVAKHQVLP